VNLFSSGSCLDECLLLHCHFIFHVPGIAISSFLVSGRMSEVSANERKGIRQSFLRFYFILSSLIFLLCRKPLMIFFAVQVNPYEFYSACKKTRALKEAFRFSRLVGRKLLRNYSMLLSVCAQAQDASGENSFLRLPSILS